MTQIQLVRPRLQWWAISRWLLLAGALAMAVLAGGTSCTPKKSAVPDVDNDDSSTGVGGHAATGGASGAGDGGAAAGVSSSGGMQGGLIPRQRTVQCGAVECVATYACCTQETRCGSGVPEYIFERNCVSAVKSEGALDAECPDSEEYCKSGYCQRFDGCRRSDDTCGFLIDRLGVVGGEGDVFLWDIQLGCVESTLLKPL